MPSTNDRLISELLRTEAKELIPQTLFQIARNLDQLEVKPIRQSTDELNFVVIEHHYGGLTDESAWNEWLHQIDTIKQERIGARFIPTPPPPPGVDRLHADFRTQIEEGTLSLQDRILLSVTLLIDLNGVQKLMVKNYDGEKGIGLAKDFYINVLPVLAKRLNLRFIVGQNNRDNISFFTKTLGRYTYSQLKPEMGKLLFLQIHPAEESFTTIQFLYPEDVQEFVLESQMK